MGSDDQPSVPEVADQVRGWIAEADAILDERIRVIEAGSAAVVALRSAVVPIVRDGRGQWRVLPLGPTNHELIERVARQAQLPDFPADLQSEVRKLMEEIKVATETVKSVTGFQRFFAFGGTRQAGQRAAAELLVYRRWYLKHGMSSQIRQLTPLAEVYLGPAGVFADWLKLPQRLGESSSSVALEPSTSFAILPNAMKIIQRAIVEETELRAAAVEAGNEVRAMETNRLLADMPVERLKEATRDRVNVGALLNLDITTVLEVFYYEDDLHLYQGLSEVSATRIIAAARTIWQSTYEEMPMRIDIKERSKEHTDLLRRLRAWEVARKIARSPEEWAQIKALAPLADAIDKDVSQVLVFCPSNATVNDFKESVQVVARCARRIYDARDEAEGSDPWDDFLSRPADYFSMLVELGFITEDEEKSAGELPEDIRDAVRDQELNTEYLNVSLRGYQSFGARFALVQRRVIIGDEMGLGKTIEALAVLSHLRAEGSHHALVICPAAVVTNWIREIRKRSALTPHRLHGAERTFAIASWIRNGGVAVTTYESLRWLNSQPLGLPKLACVVLDEAHYIKNPSAKRTERAKRILKSCDRVVMLTGTPLENRIEEFRNLVGYLRPDLIVDATEFAPKRFRRQVAPAYLRRNQEDVLTELPARFEVDEWLEMSREDYSAYREAVRIGNFMTVRQAAMLQGSRSAKVQRLREIVQEAEDNGRRVLVFSYFLDVLEMVAAALPGRVFGPLTGQTPAQRRQTMIDQFSDARGGAVLVSQILAGGVGLNIQAASVVVICEPQLKPTTEWQAIARAHRLGQVQSVQVHRLLSDEGVDVRLFEMLARKTTTFDEFARPSETAESTPDAYDVTEAELAKMVIAEERERLFGQCSPDRPSEADADFNGIALATKFEGDVPAMNAATGQLLPYTVFSGTFPPVTETSVDRTIENLLCLVEVEGPMTGYRLHEAYRDASGDVDGEETSRRLDQAIEQAVKMRLIHSDNPLGAEGIRPKTFRLPTQPEVLVRDIGPRALTHVPPAELEYHLPEQVPDREDVYELNVPQPAHEPVSHDSESADDFEEEDESYFRGRESEFILGDYES
jgi:superfamily II DNA or RNA helicase